jgi:hypothetical protein
MSAVRTAVEEAITALAAKVIASVDSDKPEATREYASALNDSCWGLEHLHDAGEGES